MEVINWQIINNQINKKYLLQKMYLINLIN